MTTPIGVHICARSSAPDPHKNTEKLRRASFSHLPHLIRRRRALRLIAHGFCFDFPLTPVGKSSKFAFNFLSVIMRDRSNLVAVRNVEFYHSKITSLFFWIQHFLLIVANTLINFLCNYFSFIIIYLFVTNTKYLLTKGRFTRIL